MLITVLLILVDATSIIVSLVMNGLEKYLIFVMVLWILMTLIYVSLGKTIICNHMWYYPASSILDSGICETFVSFSTAFRDSLLAPSTPIILWTTGTNMGATSKNPELLGLVTLVYYLLQKLMEYLLSLYYAKEFWRNLCCRSIDDMTEPYSGNIQLREVFSVNLF